MIPRWSSADDENISFGENRLCHSDVFDVVPVFIRERLVVNVLSNREVILRTL